LKADFKADMERKLVIQEVIFERGHNPNPKPNSNPNPRSNPVEEDDDMIR